MRKAKIAMSTSEVVHAVWLGSRRVGSIHQRGDYTRFIFDETYRNDPVRPVLGLAFEQDLLATHASALRLPPWFSNLLPEGRLREWIAEDRHVSIEREMELLAQVGHDLPGAVRVLPDETEVIGDWNIDDRSVSSIVPTSDQPGWRFSLAGVGLKFSMLATDDRLTLPAYGEGGDWIVKLPDRVYPDVPTNEYAMMSLARAVGIDVPEIKLIHRDMLGGLPMHVWPGGETSAYAIRRFDRDDSRGLIHIEDLAQVCNVYPERKYSGNYETVASLVYRRHDIESLREFVRRLIFIFLISNGDAHLKNWSLIYRDPQIPTLSPAYDLVATAHYRMYDKGEDEDLGLKFGGSKLFERISLSGFAHLQRRLGAQDAELEACAAETVRRVQEQWPTYADLLGVNRELLDSVSGSIRMRSQRLLDGRRG